jgi:nitrate reductase NapAB chaperone NapD
LQFVIPFYISVPIDIKDEMVRKIFVQIGNLDGFQVNEFDENGQMVPFEPGSSYGTITVDRR